MTLREGQEHFKDGLGGFFQSSEIDFYYKTLLKDGLNRDPIQLSIEPWVELTSEEEFFVKESLSKLIEHQPLQYVLGKAHFRDLTLKVDKRVLIPRPETEEMVEWVLEDFKKLNQKLRLIDMGTGSGCIGIALAKAQPYFSVFALDKDVDILDLTEENAKLNGVQIKCMAKEFIFIRLHVTFIEGNIKIIYNMAKEFINGLMALPTMENIKMALNMVKELKFGLIIDMRVNSKMANGMDLEK